MIVAIKDHLEPKQYQRIAELLDGASKQARKWQENSPLRSQDPDTERYEWGQVGAILKNMSAQLSIYAREIKPATPTKGN